MKYYIPLLIIVACTLFSSCEFSPTGTNVQQIDLPVAHADLIVLDSNQQQSLRGTVKIYYQSLYDKGRYRKAELYVDNNRICYGSEENGYFDFNTRSFSDGFHTVTMKLTLKTNSGSLADVVNAEVYVVNKTYNVYFYNGSVTRPVITSIVDDSGKVKISWSKYTQLAFYKYVIQRDGQNIAEVGDIERTYFHDSTYVGGYTQYMVSVVVGGEYFSSSYGILNKPLPTLMGERYGVDSTQIKLSWTACNYYAGFAAYLIYRNSGTNIYNTVLLATISDIHQTTFIDTTGLFGSGNYTLRLLNKNGQSPIENSNTVRLSPGNTMSQIVYGSHFEYCDSINRFLMISGGYPTNQLKVYNGSTVALNASNTLSNSTYLRLTETGSDVSMNGKWCYALVDDSPSKMYRINTDNLSVIGNSITIDDVYPYQSVYSISVSDNNRLAVIGRPDVQLSIIDMNTHTLLASSDIGEYDILRENNLSLSRGGEYILHGTMLFHYTNDTLIKIADVPKTAKFMNEPDKIIYQIENKVRVVRLPSLSVVNEFSIGNNVKMLDYDPKTGYIDCTGNNIGVYYFYDPLSGTLVKQLPVYTESSSYTFQGGVLFNNYAAFYKLHF